MAGNVLEENQPLRLGRLSADPSSGEEGEIYYNTTLKVFRQFANSVWDSIALQGYVTTETTNIPYSSLSLSGSLQATDLSSAFILPIIKGGTGQTSAASALTALLPSQTGNSGYVLTTNGTSASWAVESAGSLTNGYIFVGNASNLAAGVALSGDATITNAGVLTIASGAITNSKVSASAAIAYSKLNLSGAVQASDLAGSIPYSKLILTGDIVNADISTSAGIAYSKLSLTGSIVDADISSSAAIAYGKLNLSSSIVNNDISLTAAIARTKIAAGSSNRIVLNNSSGNLTDAAPISANYSIISDANGLPTTGGATATEISYVSGVSSSIQTQLNNRLTLSGGTLTGPLLLSGDATQPLNPVTYEQFEAAIFGLDSKSEVILATTANITLSGEQTIDGVLTSSTRVLVKNQTTTSQNGIYTSGSGAWTRTSDFNTWADVPGALIPVGPGGTVNANALFMSTAATSGTVGTTAITFNQVSGPGTYTTDGQGLALTGTQFSLVLNGGTLSKGVSGLQVANGGIADTQIASAAGIQYSKLALSGSVVNSDISTSAAIAYSKLNLATSIQNSDIATSAGIVYSKLSLTGSIVNSDISASAAIAYSKLALGSSIVNSDISSSAAIAYSKLSLGSSIQTSDLSSGFLLGGTKGGTGVSSTAVYPTSGTIVTTAATQTLTNKTFDSTSTLTGAVLASFTPDGTHTLTAPAVTDTLATLASTQTFTNKTISGSANTITNIPSSAITGLVGPASGGTGVANNAASTLTISGAYALGLTLSAASSLTLPTTGTLATLGNTETFTNKTFDSTSTLTGVKLASFTPDGTHTLTAPTVTDTLVTLAAAQTLTGKTLTGNTIASFSPDGTHTVTVQASTDTLVGRATTDTLTNKSISGSTNTLSNIPAVSLTGTVSPANGGTGVANNAASTLTITGSYPLGLTLSAASSLTLPTTGTLATLSNTETFTNKTFDSTSTLTGAKLASFTPDGTHTLTAPAVTDTLATLASAQTFTNKTISGSSNTITNIPSSAITGLLGPANGGTGVANNAASTLTITGSYPLGLTLSASTSVTLPTSGTLATLSNSETLTNKTFDSTSTLTGVKLASFTPDATHTLTAPLVTDTLTANAATQTLTNKTISGASNTLSNLPASALTGTVSPANGGTGVANNASSTLTITGAYALGLTLSAASSVTLPTTGTLATLANAETLTNKTLTGNTIASFSPDGTHTLTAPSVTDTLATLASTQTLTGKTISGSSNTLTNIPTSGLSGTVSPVNGGTGVANNSASTLTLTGSYPLGLTLSASTAVSLPTSGTLATLSNSETLTNKTLTGNTIASFSPDGTHTLTAPAATDTLALLAATQTLTNKTFDSTSTMTGAKIASFTPDGTHTLTAPTVTGTLATVNGLAPSYQASSFTAATNFNYLVNTSSAALTATLPSGAAGAMIQFTDDSSTWNSHNLTITPASGQSIQGLTANTSLICDLTGGWALLTWDSTNSYWVVSSPGFSYQSQSPSLPIVVPGTSAGLVSSSGLTGNTSGSAIATGFVGEQHVSYSQSAGTLSAATATNLTTISLGAGIWACTGGFGGSPSGAMNAVIGITATSGTTLGSALTNYAQYTVSSIGGYGIQLPAPTVYFNSSTSFTAYLNYQVGTGTSFTSAGYNLVCTRIA